MQTILHSWMAKLTNGTERKYPQIADTITLNILPSLKFFERFSTFYLLCPICSLPGKNNVSLIHHWVSVVTSSFTCHFFIFFSKFTKPTATKFDKIVYVRFVIDVHHFVPIRKQFTSCKLIIPNLLLTFYNSYGGLVWQNKRRLISLHYVALAKTLPMLFVVFLTVVFIILI